MLRKPLFWVGFLVLSLACILVSTRYFTDAFPILSIDLSTSREAALERARSLAGRYGFPPAGYAQVASFGGDQEVQNFVELEAGGAGALEAMLAKGLYHSYKWTVRHYKPGETRETVMTFTPRGDPYGFLVKLPEDEAGAVLVPERAREIAEQAASRDWQVDLNLYRLEETSRHVRPGGRLDHIFVYERPDVHIGEGRYRLRLTVGGDRLTEVTRFVKVPEAFTRRYAEMRSANQLIGLSGSIALFLLYIIGGCGIGLFFLLRQHWIIWRMPLFWGLFIAFLQLLEGINQWPLAWMDYDTAISAQGFAMQQILMILLSFLLNAALFSVSFMAAESLSRKAFPNHIQQWKLWSAGTANSREVLGRTLGGYLLVGVFFAYEVFLYLFTTRTLGWWIPSDVLVQPDVLSSYLPWLTSIANSAQAGFWEESLFRAVPIAGAALLGKRYGRRGWWIAGAMVVQAIVFGAGHAGYANQPSYARVVELIIPSLMFGGLYLYFGLLAGIVLHFAFDVVWFALPLFVSTAPGIWVDRGMVILLVLVPLWMVLGARFRLKRWESVPEAHLNRAWQPASAPTVEEAVEVKPDPGSIRPAVLRALPVLGFLGLAAWIFAGNFQPDAPSLKISRPEALQRAQRALRSHGVNLPPSWQGLAAVFSGPGEDDRFVWQTAGKEAYRSLMNEYLTPPHWQVRFLQFEGDVAEKAEEYRVFICDAKGVFRFKHVLPEARAGSHLAENDARDLAGDAVRSGFQLDPSGLKEISAVPSKLKERTDWVFTFSDPGGTELPEGEKRISVHIAGDRVVDTERFVHVPEEWQRQQRDKQSVQGITRIVCGILIALPILAGLVGAIVSWSRRRYLVPTFLLLSGLLLALNLAALVNSIPRVMAMFTTDQPFKTQMFTMLAQGVVAMLFLSATFGLIAGLAHKWCGEGRRPPIRSEWLVGISLGTLVAGVFTLCSALGPSLSPVWADHSALGTYMPMAEALDPVGSFLAQSTVLLLVFAAVSRFTQGWTRKRWFFGSLLLLYGFVVAGAQFAESGFWWLLWGAIFGSLFLVLHGLVLRYSLPVILIAMGVLQILGTIRQGILAAHPHAVQETGVAILLTGVAVWFWHGWIARGPEEAREQGEWPAGME